MVKKISNCSSVRARLFSLLSAVMLAFAVLPPAIAEQATSVKGEDIRIIQSFTQGQGEKSELVQITDQEKRAVMFYMGVPLIILLIITVGLGVAMVIYRKRVFVAHMVFAGLSLTLALAHAVVGTVWFYPF